MPEMDVNKIAARTLFVVGNGFDLYHGLPTSYENFKNWLSQNGHGDFANHLEEHFDSNHVLWTDFEAALGQCELAKSYEKLADKCTVDTSDTVTLLESVRKIVDQQFVTLIGSQLQELMRDWVESINDTLAKRKKEASSISKPPYFSKSGVFISFNYTNTLEVLYNVSSANVKHIHGCLEEKKKKKELIIGHITPYKAEKNVAMLLGESESKDAMSRALNDLKKRHKDNWNKLRIDKSTNFSKVVVYGHSLSEIDCPYFKNVLKIAPTAKWYFSYHDAKDIDNVKRLISDLQLDENKVSLFYMGEVAGSIFEDQYRKQKEQLKRYCDIYDRKEFDYVALPMSTCIKNLLAAFLGGKIPTECKLERKQIYSLLNGENKFLDVEDWYSAVIVNDVYEIHSFSRAEVLSILQETDAGVSLVSKTLRHMKLTQAHFKEELLFDAVRKMAEEILSTLDKILNVEQEV